MLHHLLLSVPTKAGSSSLESETTVLFITVFLSESSCFLFFFQASVWSLALLLCCVPFSDFGPETLKFTLPPLLLPPASGRSPQAQVSYSAFIVKDGVRSILLLIHSTFQAELIHLTGGNGFWVFRIKHGKQLWDKCSGINITFHIFYVRCIGIVLSNSMECEIVKKKKKSGFDCIKLLTRLNRVCGNVCRQKRKVRLWSLSSVELCCISIWCYSIKDVGKKKNYI